MDLEKFQESTNLNFNNKELLKLALTHSSFARKNRNQITKDNERLEFFGDAVVKLIVSEYLYKKFPDMSEGNLTKIRSSIVSDKNLSLLAKKLNLGEYIKFSHGETTSGGKTKLSNLANAFEALLGAYYLDQGLKNSEIFFINLLDEHTNDVFTVEDIVDYKTTLQELVQQHKYGLPKYTVIKEDGPDHFKEFHIEAAIKGKVTIKTNGKGHSKKEAEQIAAKAALSEFKKSIKQKSK
jgi:ribonuclease III